MKSLAFCAFGVIAGIMLSFMSVYLFELRSHIEFQRAEEKRKIDAYDLLAENVSGWNFAGGNTFLDGGSHCLSFISPYGDIMHIWIDPDRYRNDKGELKFFLKINYNDEKPLPIVSGSKLEKDVIWLLDTYYELPDTWLNRDYTNRMRNALLNRRGPAPYGPYGSMHKKLSEVATIEGVSHGVFLTDNEDEIKIVSSYNEEGTREEFLFIREDDQFRLISQEVRYKINSDDQGSR